jgi:sec-independent protein translocase protein TatC
MADEQENKEEKKEMSFLGHLEELRWRLVRISIVIILLAVAIFIFTEPLMETLYISMSKTSFPTYKLFCQLGHSTGVGDLLCVERINVQLQSTTPMGQFSANMIFAIVGGIICAFPYIAWELWSFVKPGLRSKEKKATTGIVLYSTLLFAAGVLFGYFVIAALCVQFFSNFQMSDDINNIFTITSYMSMITNTTFFTGLFFQLPIVTYILSKLGIMTPEFMRKYRKHAIVVVLILSAIITPPDFISQVIVSIPVLILYEVSIRVSMSVVKKREAQN